MKNSERKDSASEKFFGKIKSGIKDKFYDLSVLVSDKFPKRKNNLSVAKRSELLFYIVFMAFPILQFSVFYVVVNINSLLLAFQTYNQTTGNYSFNGLVNFKQFFFELSLDGSPLKFAVKNSLTVYAVKLLVGVTLSLLFSYYIYKKKAGSGLFKVMLFLPSIISSIVMVILFKYLVEQGIPEFFNKIFHKTVAGPLSQSSTRFATIVFYSTWIGFGTGVLMYTGAMTRIPKDVSDYASLDGISDIKEFFYITLPLIYPTLSAFLVVEVANLFINQAHIYSFYPRGVPDESIYTIGYFLFRKVVGNNTTTFADYPYASAAGIMFTLVAAPVTLIFRYFLEKLGPSTDY